ncbi:MAG TPA: NAD(P)H-dependent glycerol-3-phosphate dehydrogenase [Membranihabitans sp.]|nr:NAD(P)H-dependent glycerol-3-phosphate dehydrogenase [Membranihabitans sp.]
MDNLVGVIGSGNFGTALSVLLSGNTSVLLYSRHEEEAASINRTHENLGWQLSPNIRAITSLDELCQKCSTIFIAIPSREFSHLAQQMAPYLTPQHIIIHGVKGFALREHVSKNYMISPHGEFPVHTMSEVLKKETNVVRIGCLSGPNLSKELLKRLPAASVIASSYNEVMEMAQNLLDQENFKVYRSPYLKGTEIAGALKNIIAIASGMVNGQKLGKNLESIIITKGLRDMLMIGTSLDIPPQAFLGLAGIGDLIATSTAHTSRNFSFGYAVGESDDIDQVLTSTADLVEGIDTTRIIFEYIQKTNLSCPVIHMVYDVIFHKKKVKEAVDHIYRQNVTFDVDFL